MQSAGAAPTACAGIVARAVCFPRAHPPSFARRGKKRVSRIDHTLSTAGVAGRIAGPAARLLRMTSLRSPARLRGGVDQADRSHESQWFCNRLTDVLMRARLRCVLSVCAAL